MTDETCCGACGYPIHATKEMACDWCRQSADRIEALTAKLAQAVETLKVISQFNATESNSINTRAIWRMTDRASFTLAEIKGEQP
jgi:predicted dithiol-disulfide oxidoreductase (DUF899 family)